MSERFVKRFSVRWYKTLRDDQRFHSAWPDFHGPRMPTMPWITPPLHPELLQKLFALGHIYDFEAGQPLLADSLVTAFGIVLEGLTGRIASTLEGQRARAMALSSPRRWAFGNLNFYTRRPAIGRYVSLTKSRVMLVRDGAIEDLLEQESRNFSRLFFTQIELCILSDRLGFAVLSLLPAPMRLQAFLLAWAEYYGHIENLPGRGDVITMPVPGRREHIEQVISVSLATLDKLITDLHANAQYERDNEDFVQFQASALQPAHEWMSYADGDNAEYRRPKRVEDMLYQAQENDHNPT